MASAVALVDLGYAALGLAGAARVLEQTEAVRLTFGFVGAASLPYRVEASFNLFDWIPLFVLPASGTNIVEFSDPAAASLPRRFYRAVMP